MMAKCENIRWRRRELGRAAASANPPPAEIAEEGRKGGRKEREDFGGGRRLAMCPLSTALF